jgi:hypothetical protein
MNILDQFTIVQRNRIEAVWGRKGGLPNSIPARVRRWAIAIMPNIVESVALAWTIWFGGPVIVGV